MPPSPLPFADGSGSTVPHLKRAIIFELLDGDDPICPVADSPGEQGSPCFHASGRRIRAWKDPPRGRTPCGRAEEGKVTNPAAKRPTLQHREPGCERSQANSCGERRSCQTKR